MIGPHIDMTLEQFEIDFMRDMHPEREIAIWCRIAKAWLAYHEDFVGNEILPNEEERKLLGALVAISTGVEDLSKLAGRGWTQVGSVLRRSSRRVAIGDKIGD